MSLPQNLTPPPEDPAPTTDPAPETTASTEPVVEVPTVEVVPDPAPEPAPTETPEEIAAEDASDAQLRAWAKDNGIDGVPASGRLSATWREQITAAMAAAAEPAPEEPDPVVEVDSTEESSPDSTEEESPAERPLTGPGSDQPEFAHGGDEYRSVFQAPDTFMWGQNYTA